MPLSFNAIRSLSLIVVVTGEPLTPAALLRLTVKFSGPSTSTSSTVARLTLASVAPAARSLAPVLVTVKVTAPVAASVLTPLRLSPLPATSPPATSLAKSATSVAVPEAESSVIVTDCPTISPTPSSLTS